jgi:hypothetical protein
VIGRLSWLPAESVHVVPKVGLHARLAFVGAMLPLSDT